MAEALVYKLCEWVIAVAREQQPERQGRVIGSKPKQPVVDLYCRIAAGCDFQRHIPNEFSWGTWTEVMAEYPFVEEVFFGEWIHRRDALGTKII